MIESVEYPKPHEASKAFCSVEMPRRWFVQRKPFICHRVVGILVASWSSKNSGSEITWCAARGLAGGLCKVQLDSQALATCHPTPLTVTKSLVVAAQAVVLSKRSQGLAAGRNYPEGPAERPHSSRPAELYGTLQDLNGLPLLSHDRAIRTAQRRYCKCLGDEFLSSGVYDGFWSVNFL